MPVAAGPVAPIDAHHLLVFLLQVGALLALAVGLGRLAIRVGAPAIVGELAAGVIAGPSILAPLVPDLQHWLFPAEPEQFHLLDAVGQLGVLLLVGITGAHLDLGLIRRRGVAAAKISIAGVAIPLGLGVVAGLLMPASLVPHPHQRPAFVLFLGVAMAVSAIPVIAKMLLDMRLMHRNIGQLTLTAVMLDDLVGWLLLAVVSAMATTGVRHGRLALAVGGIVAVMALGWLLRPAVRYGLRAAARAEGEGRGGTIGLVVVLVLLSAAGTQAFGLEAVFGAFVCGIVLNAAGLDPARIAPLRTTVLAFVAPVFFATAGLRMDLTLLARPQVLLVGLVLLAAAIAGKFAGAYLGARASRLSHWEGLALGAGMNARGVIEVIIAMAGLRLGVLSPQMYTVIVLIAVVTSLMAPPVLRLAMTRVEYTSEERIRAEIYDADLSARKQPTG